MGQRGQRGTNLQLCSQRWKYNIGNVVHNVEIMLYSDHIYGGEHWVMSRIAESLCCTPEGNITLYVSYTSAIKNL